MIWESFIKETFTDGSPANNPDLQAGGMFTASHDTWSDDSHAADLHDLTNMIDGGDAPMVQYDDGGAVKQATVSDYEQDTHDDGKLFFFGNDEDGEEVSVNGSDIVKVIHWG